MKNQEPIHSQPDSADLPETETRQPPEVKKVLPETNSQQAPGEVTAPQDTLSFADRDAQTPDGREAAFQGDSATETEKPSNEPGIYQAAPETAKRDENGRELALMHCFQWETEPHPKLHSLLTMMYQFPTIYHDYNPQFPPAAVFEFVFRGVRFLLLPEYAINSSNLRAYEDKAEPHPAKIREKKIKLPSKTRIKKYQRFYRRHGLPIPPEWRDARAIAATAEADIKIIAAYTAEYEAKKAAEAVAEVEATGKVVDILKAKLKADAAAMAATKARAEANAAEAAEVAAKAAAGTEN